MISFSSNLSKIKFDRGFVGRPRKFNTIVIDLFFFLAKILPIAMCTNRCILILCSPANCAPDSCTAAANFCGANSVCNSTTTPATCRCLPGYTGNATIGCTDIDECSSNPCSSSTTCVNTPGTFKCLTRSFSPCSRGLDDTCLGGNCGRTSRSEAAYVCCDEAGECGNEKCCNGAYGAGEQCPSGNTLDCVSGLTCARRNALTATKICCQNTVTLPFVGTTCSQ